MAGRHQIGNAVTALEIIRVLRRLGYDIPEEAVEQGMEQTVWPGRFSCIGDEPTFIIDGAHNEDAARKLRESVEMYFPGRRLLCIMGVFKDKEYDKMAQIMGPLASVIYPVALPDRKRALKPYCPCVRAPGRNTWAPAAQRETVIQAVKTALAEAGKEDAILAFGSLSYLYQVKEAYDEAVRKKRDER